MLSLTLAYLCKQTHTAKEMKALAVHDIDASTAASGDPF